MLSRPRLALYAGLATWIGAALWSLPVSQPDWGPGFSARSYNFGVLSDREAPCVVTFRNRGKTDLNLQYVGASCSCVEVKDVKGIVRAGEEVSIPVVLGEGQGQVAVFLTAVWLQDGGLGQSTCHLSAEVNGELVSKVRPVADAAFKSVR